MVPPSNRAISSSCVPCSTIRPWSSTTIRPARWIVETDRGDKMRARFVVLANGILTTPKLARIEGMESFAGKAFHTSRWDYNYDLEGKRVGIIGTGATAVQVVPEIAKVVKQLYVFQRTPSTIDVRDQRAGRRHPEHHRRVLR